MASRKTLDRRRAVLRARGVPEKFVEAIARRRGPLGFIVGLLLRLFLPIIAVVALTSYFSRVINVTVAPWLYGAPAASFLVLGPDIAMDLSWIGAVVALALVFTHMVAVNGPARRSPAADQQALLLRSGHPATVKRNDRYAALGDLPDDRAFLDAVRQPVATKAGRLWVIWLVMLVLGAVEIANQLSRFTVVRGDTIEMHHWGRTKPYRLSDAGRVEVACHDNGGFAYRLYYGHRVIGIDRRYAYLHDALHDLGPGQVIERLSVIDARLSALHVRIDRVPPMGSPADEAGRCVGRTAANWPAADRAVLRRLVFGQ